MLYNLFYFLNRWNYPVGNFSHLLTFLSIIIIRKVCGSGINILSGLNKVVNFNSVIGYLLRLVSRFYNVNNSGTNKIHEFILLTRNLSAMF